MPHKDPQRKREYAREYFWKHRDRIIEKRKYYKLDKRRKHDLHLQKAYGITIDDYERMFKECGGVCSICRKPERRRLAVDHNHSTGQVRNLLCSGCNHGLWALEDLEWQEKALAYLKRYEEWKTCVNSVEGRPSGGSALDSSKPVMRVRERHMRHEDR